MFILQPGGRLAGLALRNGRWIEHTPWGQRQTRIWDYLNEYAAFVFGTLHLGFSQN